MTTFPVEWRPSPNYRRARRPNIRRPIKGVVLHYTATEDWDLALALLTGQAGGRKVSAHYLVGRDPGEIAQLVHLKDVAWHAKGANALSVGIEMVNVGGGKEVRGRTCQRYGRRWVPISMQGTPHKEQWGPYDLWEPFTQWQYDAVAQIMAAIRVREGSPIAAWRHSELDPERKLDPGPAFDMKLARDRFNYWRVIMEGRRPEDLDPLTSIEFYK